MSNNDLTDVAPDQRELAVGSLVVLKDAPDRGIGRLERFLDEGGARIFFYPGGDFWVGPSTEVIPCPVGFPMMTDGKIPPPKQ